jgi:hypothetical protein
MRRFLTWVNATDAAKTNALLGATGFALTLLLVGSMSLIAFSVYMWSARVVVVPEGWQDILDSILIATAVWAGVSQAAQIGRRAVTKPAVVEAEANAEAKKEIAKAEATAVLRKSGAVPVVPDAAPLRGDVP